MILNIQYNLYQDLSNFEAWSTKWLLKFNPFKTKAIYFRTRNNAVTPSLNFKDCNLEFVNSHKLIGVIFFLRTSPEEYVQIILLIIKSLSLHVEYFIYKAPEYASDVREGC